MKLFVLFILLFVGCTQVKFEVGKRNEQKMLKNTGIVRALEENVGKKTVKPEILKGVFGIHIDSSGVNGIVPYEMVDEDSRSGVLCRLGKFRGYDGIEIPFYEILPPNFDSQKKYPAIIMFSGHGDMDQVAHKKWTYQKGAGLMLAKEGFIVYTMENRGMGMLSHLGDHMKIDAVARLTGGSWYGELITDGLYLLDLIVGKNYVNTKRIGAGGVSTGGALSMFVAALDQRINSTYVQGYLGSFKTTFGIRSNHHTCNNIAGILNHFDLQDIAASISPRKAMYVNGERDTFYYQDAQEAFDFIEKRYQDDGVRSNVSFQVPVNTIHELSTDLLLQFFRHNL